MFRTDLAEAALVTTRRIPFVPEATWALVLLAAGPAISFLETRCVGIPNSQMN